MYDSSITSKISGLIYWMVMIFIFDCVILQTSHYFNSCNKWPMQQLQKWSRPPRNFHWSKPSPIWSEGYHPWLVSLYWCCWQPTDAHYMATCASLWYTCPRTGSKGNILPWQTVKWLVKFAIIGQTIVVDGKTTLKSRTAGLLGVWAAKNACMLASLLWRVLTCEERQTHVRLYRGRFKRNNHN